LISVKQTAFILLILFVSNSLIADQQRKFVVIGDQEPVFRYYDENGQVKGIDIEIIDLVMNEMKRPYKFNLVNSTERGVIEAKRGNVDMLMSKIMKEDRKSFLIYPQETYRNIAWNFFIRKEDEGKIKYDSINDLKNLKVGATKSFAYTDEFWAAGLNLEIVTNNSLQINKLIYKRFDIVPMTTLSTLYDARRNKQLDKITYLPKVLVFTKLYNVFTKASTFPDKDKLIKEYDRVIRLMIKNGRIKAIFDKYNYTEELF